MKNKTILLFFLSVFLSGSLFAQKYGEDSLACIENLSLYKINFRIWKDHKYSEEVIKQVPIYEPWKWVFDNCPQSSQNIYLDGIKIVEYYYINTDDKTRKENLIDTLMLIYDRRIEHFGDTKTSREGKVLGRKGVDLYTYRPGDTEEIYSILNRSIELEGNKSTGPTLVYFFRATINGAKSGLHDSSVIVENYDKISEIIDYNLKLNQNNAKSLANWENVQGNIEKSFEPFATCEDLISIYNRKFIENPDDVEMLTKITRILDKKDCTESELFFEATKKLHELQPTGESAYLMGIMNIKKENFSDAAKYLEESVGLVEDVDRKADAYYLLSNLAMNMKQYQEARSYAYKGLELRPDDGSFYMIIGDMYAASAGNCGDNDLTTKVAYWAAVDKYYKAKNTDNSLEEEANKRIAAYSKQFPSVETIFFYDLTEGDTYTVGCWINETTKVRASK